MIDPARIVTANFRIDYVAVFQSEVESVWIVVVWCSFPRGAFACVLNDARALANELRGVNAPAVHAGLANFDLNVQPPRCAFLRHAHSLERRAASAISRVESGANARESNSAVMLRSCAPLPGFAKGTDGFELKTEGGRPVADYCQMLEWDV